MRGTWAFKLSDLRAEGRALDQSGHSLSIGIDLRVFAIPTNQVWSYFREEKVNERDEFRGLVRA